MNTQEVMKQQDQLMRIKSQLFTVAKTPLYAPPLEAFRSTLGTADAAPLGKPHVYGLYKTTGGDPLGTSGEMFKPVQPVDLLTAFTNCLMDVQGYGGAALDLSKLKYTERKGGSRIEFSIPIPGIGFVNKAGLRDIMNMFLTVSTGFDGTATKFRLDVERLICLNGWTAINSEFSASIRSTKNAKERIAFSCDEIAKTIADSSGTEELIRKMNMTDLSGRKTREYVERVFRIDQSEEEDLHALTQKRLDKIMESIDLEMRRSGATVWGALNGITHYTNHVAETKGDRDDYIMIGTGAQVNKRAQRLALELLS